MIHLLYRLLYLINPKALHTEVQESLNILLVKYYNDLLDRQSSGRGTMYADCQEKILAELQTFLLSFLAVFLFLNIWFLPYLQFRPNCVL